MGTDSLESISELPFYRGLRKGYSPSHKAGKQVAELGFRPSSGFRRCVIAGSLYPVRTSLSTSVSGSRGWVAVRMDGTQRCSARLGTEKAPSLGCRCL